jgi:hypothetical protein
MINPSYEPGNAVNQRLPEGVNMDKFEGGCLYNTKSLAGEARLFVGRGEKGGIKLCFMNPNYFVFIASIII